MTGVVLWRLYRRCGIQYEVDRQYMQEDGTWSDPVRIKIGEPVPLHRVLWDKMTGKDPRPQDQPSDRT